jgi:protocatechuate 3,4-dioxygenase, alpha subunit
VLDGEGAPVPDALVETWEPAARAFTRSATDDDGAWQAVTPRAPFLAVNVLARGLLHRLVTRIYFDEAAVPDVVPAERRHTLIARPEGDGFRFDIHLQGEEETVFFDV